MDVAISKWIMNNMHGNDFFNRLMFIVTEIGIGYIFWLILIVILIAYHFLKRKKFSLNCLFFLVFLLLAHIIGEGILKNIVQRERPFYSLNDFQVFMGKYHYALPTGYSFPSGHTFCAFAVAFSITLYNKKFAFLIPLAALVGFSRIFIGAHYFSDVLIGAILGAILGVCHYFLVKFINQKRKNYKYLCD